MATYRVSDECADEKFRARSDEAAERRAKRWLLDVYGPSDRTCWGDCRLERINRGTVVAEWTVAATIKATVPPCVDADDHDWQRPREIVGGLKENPGVWGHGGGVVIHECCVRCGCRKTTDTWAQRPDTGEQGLRSVEYEPHAYLEELLATRESEAAQ